MAIYQAIRAHTWGSTYLADLKINFEYQKINEFFFGIVIVSTATGICAEAMYLNCISIILKLLTKYLKTTSE